MSVVMLVLAMIVWFLGRAFLDGNYFNRMVQSREDKEILSDSIAVKITQNPQALESAVNKTETALCDLLGYSENAEHPRKVRWWNRTYADDCIELFQRRITNVQAIMQGTWPAFQRFE
jgi:hypothetical protein